MKREETPDYRVLVVLLLIAWALFHSRLQRLLAWPWERLES